MVNAVRVGSGAKCARDPERQTCDLQKRNSDLEFLPRRFCEFARVFGGSTSVIFAGVGGGQSRRWAADDLDVSPMFFAKMLTRYERAGSIEPVQPQHSAGPGLALAKLTKWDALLDSAGSRQTKFTMAIGPLK